MDSSSQNGNRRSAENISTIATGLQRHRFKFSMELMNKLVLDVVDATYLPLQASNFKKYTTNTPCYILGSAPQVLSFVGLMHHS
jgi:hypothetical protein